MQTSFPGLENEGICVEADLVNGETPKRQITQQQAAQTFCLSLQSLRDAVSQGLLTVEERPNPHGATFRPMRLYRVEEVQQLAWRVWGGPAQLEEERGRRREQRWQIRQKRLLGSVIAPEDASRRGAPAALQRPTSGGALETRKGASKAQVARRRRRASTARNNDRAGDSGARETRGEAAPGRAISGEAETPGTCATPPRSDELQWEVI
ncbi:hypothetical protein TGARI_254460 [Toxoplasma gondii ARI]|uniref:XPA C-terminal domain-containing protein n=1 Tax=Toxoplasma gondii ARI TaxID=1074872 RepID=A0A139XT63_TOXGO|nr:hypothetical protein TGARI_254460 [Toxoplasma gondii ARI]